MHFLELRFDGNRLKDLGLGVVVTCSSRCYFFRISSQDMRLVCSTVAAKPLETLIFRDIF